ncbi:MAG: PKD domain-containing protein, partial [Mariniphaga sp.]
MNTNIPLKTRKLILTIGMVLLSGLGFAVIPAGHFVPVWIGNGNDQMTFIITSASIGGVDLEAGDEIASFDGNICTGSLVITKKIGLLNSYFPEFRASRKDDEASNGYTVGNAISFKFWDSSANLEISGIMPLFVDNTNIPTTTPVYTPNITAYVNLSYVSPNKVPVANAGTDQSVIEGTLVTLDGSTSNDPDGNTLTYKWSAPAGITLSSTTAIKPTFTSPDVATSTNYTFSLIVNDGTVDSPADLVVITVNPLPDTAGTITGSATVCQGQGSVVYTVPTIVNATSYVWTLPIGATGTSETNSISVSYAASAASGNITVKGHNANGDGTVSTLAIIVNELPTAPAAGTITQPTCTLATGSVILNDLPATGSWSLTGSPGAITKTGTGTSYTFADLAAGTYTFTVTNAAGCTSTASGSVAINTQPATPTAPAAGTITQPTCALATGSVILNDLPATGSWSLTGSPGAITKT